MDGVNGYHSWRWIFILEGILTAVVAVIGYFFMHGFPEDAIFLSKDDKEYILARLKHDAGGATSDTLTLKMVLSVFRDWQIWCMYRLFHTPLTQFDDPPRNRYCRILSSILYSHNTSRLWLYCSKSPTLFHPSWNMRNNLVTIFRIPGRSV